MATGRFEGIGRVLIGVALLLPLVGLLTMAGGGSAEASGTVQVTISGFMYQSDDITIAAGTTVVWTNMESDPLLGHDVRSEDGAFESSGLLYNSSPAARTYSYTFREAGIYLYRCTPHFFMMGRITVVEVATATPLSLPTRRPDRTLPPPYSTPRAAPPTRARPTPLPTAGANTPTPVPIPTPLPAPVRR